MKKSDTLKRISVHKYLHNRKISINFVLQKLKH